MIKPDLEKLEQLKQLINRSDHILVLTGAGISTESGISDYRSQGGIWDRFQPVTIQEFIADEQKRILYWQRKLALYEENKQAQPNEGHRAIVKIEKQNRLLALITQNIDGLHQLAGHQPEKIIEIHGTNQEVICLSCGSLNPWQMAYSLLKSGVQAPECDICQGLLKPNTISFGQSLKADVLQKAFALAAECDLMLVVGSSLVVEPVASLPSIAKRSGASLAIITQSDTPVDHLADVKISAGIGKTLRQIL